MVSWNKKLNTGIPAIDKQHKHFVQLLNEADALIDNGADKSKALAAVKKLDDYAREHFATEEKFMKESNYPFLNEQILEHQKLLKDTEDFYYGIHTEQRNVAELCIFLWEWFEKHLKEHDRKFAEYLKKNNIKLN